MTKLQSKNIDVSLFTEPDLNDQLTAIAISPSREARKMLSYLPKAGKSVGEVCKRRSRWQHKKRGDDTIESESTE